MRIRTTLAATALVSLASGAAVAPAETGRHADQKITAAGVGKVKVGKTFTSLRAAGLVGKLRPGCPLAGANTRSARLRAPLKGSVDLTTQTPRKVRSISITGGATARGVGIGGTIAQITAAYPKARVNHGPEETFGITLVTAPKNGGGRISFAVDVDSQQITQIGVPFIPFCE
ncbi:MAG TPA: hypothetical protein VK631_22520 [Solirubrobacteraceae bacterium]|nr:hypothetical protein [Solirubrobacteraceae bacterium]